MKGLVFFIGWMGGTLFMAYVAPLLTGTELVEKGAVQGPCEWPNKHPCCEHHEDVMKRAVCTPTGEHSKTCVLTFYQYTDPDAASPEES